MVSLNKVIVRMKNWVFFMSFALPSTHTFISCLLKYVYVNVQRLDFWNINIFI